MMPLEPGPYTTCYCGAYKIQMNTAFKHGDIVHRVNAPCYSLNHTTDKETNMEFTTFVRKPFVVEAVEITTDNIEEVAKHVGDLRHKEDGTPFILVDRRLVPNVFRVYVGFYMTKMGENVRCYSRKIFREQFIVKDDNLEQWLDFLAKGDEVDAAEA